MVVLVAIGIYIAATALGGTTPHEGGEDDTAAVQELFFSSVERPMDAGDYIYSYTEMHSNGYHADVTISRKGNESYSMRRDPVSGRAAYFGANESVVCITYLGEEKCAEVNSTSPFAGYALSLQQLLYNEESAAAMEDHYGKLVQYGGMDFFPEMAEKEVGGNPCTEINYTMDYSRLTVAQLNEIGLTANDPLLLRSSQYDFTACIGAGGDVYYRKLHWIDLGQEAWMESTATESVWGRGLDIQKPAQLVETDELYSFYQEIASLASEYLTCIAGNNTDRCIAEAAVSWKNPGLCVDSGTQQDFCYINAGLGAEDPSVCGNVSAGLRDGCYLEFANLLQDASYCERITDAALRQQCDDLNISVAGECSADADCMRTGCSSQLCVPTGNSDVVDTCEYGPEYACLAQTSCGCVEGRCSWRQTPDYLNCLNVTMVIE
ncbi:MAG: eight-cysteine-cluster domain-containing protein [Candidatus ainarchaeum sp.]|nr:eight-cysteine-cluster domain-containing protein [Candidatus ainarchaeum sp.]